MENQQSANESMQQRTDSSDQSRTVLRSRKVRKIGLDAKEHQQVAETSYLRPPPYKRIRSTQSRKDSQVYNILFNFYHCLKYTNLAV